MYALSGGAGGGAGAIAEGKVVAFAALDDAKVAARLRDDASGDAGAVAVTLEERFCDGLGPHGGVSGGGAGGVGGGKGGGVALNTCRHLSTGKSIGNKLDES